MHFSPPIRRMLALWLVFAAAVQPGLRAAERPPVGLDATGGFYTLTNGTIAAKIHPRSGDLVSLRFHGRELLEGGSGHPFAYWSHTPGRGAKIAASVTLDPATNGGERAEVSIKGVSGGAAQGSGPGGGAAVDIEIRYSLGRNDSGLYTWSILEHPASYPFTSIGEARFGAKLNPALFDHLTIDRDRRRIMPRPEDWAQGTPLNLKEARRLTTGRYAGEVEHKYDYSAIQFETPAYGWSSTEHRIGFWFINPTVEYLSGGATKVELTGHLDVNDDAAPTLLNYWRGSHYGGSSCIVTQGEHWQRVIGPFLIYCNAGSDPDGLWQDALARARTETAAWPYAWARHPAYTPAEERGQATGRIRLVDPVAPTLQFSNLLVGLAAPAYPVPRSQGRTRRQPGPADTEDLGPVDAGRVSPTRPQFGLGGRLGVAAGPETIDWQMDAKFYQFWTRGDADGRFTVPDVRPGTYTLHAIADGVLGEFARTDVTVAAGQTVDLGTLDWTPVRHGSPLWEIGVANRSGSEFRHGDHYWRWGLYHDYAKEFPDDVTFVVGQSDPRKDWNFLQAARPDRPNGTPWTIRFVVSEERARAWTGDATLRLGIAGASIRGGIGIAVNGAPAGFTEPIPDNATIRRDGIRGWWTERSVVFPVRRMQAGTNTLVLTIPPGGATSGVIYDYLRLEAKP